MKKTIIILVLLTSQLYCFSQKHIDSLKTFEKKSWEALNSNPIEEIGKNWMLITAGNSINYNMMTASWGTIGYLWERPVAFIFVRPQRYTFQFVNNEDYFTLSFFTEDYKDVLKKMGTVSGRNFDKIGYERINAVITENNTIAFAEARVIIECKKIYSSVIAEENFIDISIPEKIYPKKDYHTMYIGEILNVWIKK